MGNGKDRNVIVTGVEAERIISTHLRVYDFEIRALQGGHLHLKLETQNPRRDFEAAETLEAIVPPQILNSFVTAVLQARALLPERPADHRQD